MVFPTLASLADFVLLVKAGGGANPLQQAAYGLGKVVQFTFPLGCVWYLEGRLDRPGRPRLTGLTLGLAFGVIVGAGMIGLYYLFFRETPAFSSTAVQLRQKLREFGADSPAGFAAFAVGLSIPHSLLEEYYWRWFVFGRLRLLVGVPAAVVVSALAFMAHHVVVLAVYFPGQWLTAIIPYSLCVAGGGAVWAWLYQRTGALYAPWLSHALVDAALFVVGYDLFFVRAA